MSPAARYLREHAIVSLAVLLLGTILGVSLVLVAAELREPTDWVEAICAQAAAALFTSTDPLEVQRAGAALLWLECDPADHLPEQVTPGS